MKNILSILEFSKNKPEKELLKIKIFQQSDDSLCGPAVIKMVLEYYNKKVEESEITKLCKHTYELGTDDVHMKKAVEKLGFNVVIKNNCTISDLKYWISKKNPVIVDWFSGVLEETSKNEKFIYNKKLPIDIGTPNGHSSIVVGVDDEYVYLVDPYIAKIRKMTIVDFMRVWFDFRTPYIKDYKDMIIRQIFVILPKK